LLGDEVGLGVDENDTLTSPSTVNTPAAFPKYSEPSRPMAGAAKMAAPVKCDAVIFPPWFTEYMYPSPDPT